MKKIIIQNLIVAICFFTFQFTFGLIIRHRDFNSDNLIKAAIVPGVATLILTAITVFHQISYIKKYKIPLNDFDIRRTQSLTFTVNQSIEATTNIIENTMPAKIKSNKFKYDNEKGIYRAETTDNALSFGETVVIKLTQLDNNKTELNVMSKPLFKPTIINYGKSSINVQIIKLAFDQNGL